MYLQFLGLILFLFDSNLIHSENIPIKKCTNKPNKEKLNLFAEESATKIKNLIFPRVLRLA